MRKLTAEETMEFWNEMLGALELCLISRVLDEEWFHEQWDYASEELWWLDQADQIIY